MGKDYGEKHIIRARRFSSFLMYFEKARSSLRRQPIKKEKARFFCAMSITCLFYYFVKIWDVKLGNIPREREEKSSLQL